MAKQKTQQVEEIDPFAAAEETNTGKPNNKKECPIYVVDDVKDGAGNVIISKQALIDSLNKYVEGDKKITEGENMQEMSEKPLKDFGLRKFAALYAFNGTCPDNAKICLTPDAKGIYLGFQTKDQEMAMKPDEQKDLINLIGVQNQNTALQTKTDYTFNSDVLEMEVDYEGKKIQVLKLIGTLLQKHLPKEVLPKLMTKTTKTVTKKGLIKQLVNIVGKDENKIIETVKLARIPVALKAGSI